MSKWLEFLREKLGDSTIGIFLTLVAGASIYIYATDFFVTSEKFDSGCTSMAVAMERGDQKNLYQILSLQIESLQREKMQVETYIMINQNGQCNETQRRQLDELSDKIKKLEYRREEVIRTLSKE